MKRKFALLAALTILVSLILTSCGASKKAASMPAAEAACAAPQAMPDPRSDYGGIADMSMPAGDTTGGENAVLRESKLIRTASVEVQTTRFDEACKVLDTLKDRCGGYYEIANISGGEYGAKNGSRNASYTVRVPKEQYEQFLGAVGEVGHVVNTNQGQEDVGDAYYDAELRLTTQRTKYDRLLTLLGKAEKMEDIISLENAISETQYQIDQFTSSLKRYDDLVDFATVEIRLYEVIVLTDQPGEAEALSTRMGKAFTGGLSDFGGAMGNFFVWCAYNLLGLICFAAIVTAGSIVAVKKLKRKHTASALSVENPETKE